MYPQYEYEDYYDYDTKDYYYDGEHEHRPSSRLFISLSQLQMISYFRLLLLRHVCHRHRHWLGHWLRLGHGFRLRLSVLNWLRLGLRLSVLYRLELQTIVHMKG